MGLESALVSRYDRAVHWDRPTRLNGISTFPSAPVVASLPTCVHVLPFRYCSLNTLPASTGSSAPDAVAVLAQLLPVQSRSMSSETFGVGAMVSTSVRLPRPLSANNRFVSFTT